MKFAKLDFEVCKDGQCPPWRMAVIVSGVHGVFEPTCEAPITCPSHGHQTIHEIGLACEMFGFMAEKVNENNLTVHCGSHIYEYMTHCFKVSGLEIDS